MVRNKKIAICIIAIAVIAIFGIILLLNPEQNNSSQNLIQPVSGKYLSFPNGSLSKIYLINSTARYGTYEEDMINPLFSVKKGEPCVILNATIRSDYDKDYFMIALVQLYNTSGEKVGQVTKIGAPWKSFEQVYAKSDATSTFEVYVKYDKKDVESYDISLDSKLLDEPLP